MESGARSRFVVNVVGLVGLVFGALPIVRYVLDLSFFEFTVAPYAWMRLGGAARVLPPLLVLVTCLVVAYALERRLQRD